MNRWKCASLAGALAVIAGHGTLSPAAAIELKLNGLHAPEHPVSLTHHFFADRVAQLTGGEITVDVFDARQLGDARSEERRVGKECRSRWSPYH